MIDHIHCIINPSIYETMKNYQYVFTCTCIYITIQFLNDYFSIRQTIFQHFRWYMYIVKLYHQKSRVNF